MSIATTSDCCLIVFVRNDIPQQVKTRLAADIGDVRARSVYLRLQHITRQMTEQLAVNFAIYYSDFIPEKDLWTGDGFTTHLQQGPDLGSRMSNALHNTLQSFSRAVLIGSDIPDINPDIIENAFVGLDFADVVIGPATDGGYYLIGCRECVPEMFYDIAWSTDKVFTQTQHALLDLNVNFKILPAKTDIDTMADMHQFPWLLDGL